MRTSATSTHLLTRAHALPPEALGSLPATVGSALSTVAPGTTFVAIGDEHGGVRRYVVSSGSNAQNRAFQLAQAFGARSEGVDEPPSLVQRHLVRLTFDGSSSLGQSTQQGSTPATVAEAIDVYLREGEWVAVSVRKPTKLEKGRWSSWLGHHLPGVRTHHSLRDTVKVVSLWAGSDDPARAHDAIQQVTAAMGGFDIAASALPVSRARLMAPMFAATLVTLLVAAGVQFGAAPLADFIASSSAEGTAAAAAAVRRFATSFAPWLWVLGGVVITLLALQLARLLPSRWSRLLQRLDQGMLPSPPARWLPPRAPRREQTKTVRDDNGEVRTETVAARDGDYPLASTSFLMSPEIAAAVALPGQSATSGSAGTAERAVPPAMTREAGPLIGTTSSGISAFLSAADLWSGVLLLGRAGSGKSALLEWLWGWLAANSTAVSQAQIGLDTKGDSEFTRRCSAWSARAGKTLNVIRLADPTVPVPLNLFDDHGSLLERAERIVDTMKYVMGKDAIQGLSTETLKALLPLAMIVNDDIAARVPKLRGGASVFYYAHVLAGGHGDTMAVELHAAIESWIVALDEQDEGFDETLSRATIIFGPGVTPSARREATKAARNKLDSLVSCEPFWRESGKPGMAGWAFVLSGQSVMFDFAGLDEQKREDLSKFVLYTLRKSIERHAVGYERLRRSIKVFSDELKMPAGTSGEVVSWLRSDARAYGVELYAATQYLEQIDPVALTATMSLGTKVIFGQDVASVAERLATELSITGDRWTKEDVANLPRWTAIVSALVGQRRQPAFTVTVPDFWAEHVGEAA